MGPREIAIAWMPGCRFGSERPAWCHPEDVAGMVGEVPGEFRRELAEEVAWLHDVIEDGVVRGIPVSAEMLASEGISPEVVEGVVALSCVPGEDKKEYFVRLLAAPLEVRIVKCLDRIANLREGAPCFPEARWAKYVEESVECVMPIAASVPGVAGEWLAARLGEAMAVRPV